MRPETHGRVAPRGALPASGVRGVIRREDRKGVPGWGGGVGRVVGGPGGKNPREVR